MNIKNGTLKERVISLRKRGYTYGRISKIVGVSKSTAYEYCKGIGQIQTVNLQTFDTGFDEEYYQQKLKKYEEREILYGIGKNELEYLKKDYARLEQDVYQLKKENELLFMENRDLNSRINTASRELEYAVKKAIVETKQSSLSGLGALADPQVINNLSDAILRGMQFWKTMQSSKQTE